MRKSAISEKQGSNYRNLAKIGIEVFFGNRNSAGKITSSILDMTSFSTFSNKNASVGTIYLKLGRIVDFDV